MQEDNTGRTDETVPLPGRLGRDAAELDGYPADLPAYRQALAEAYRAYKAEFDPHTDETTFVDFVVAELVEPSAVYMKSHPGRGGHYLAHWYRDRARSLTRCHASWEDDVRCERDRGHPDAHKSGGIEWEDAE